MEAHSAFENAKGTIDKKDFKIQELERILQLSQKKSENVQGTMTQQLEELQQSEASLRANYERLKRAYDELLGVKNGIERNYLELQEKANSLEDNHLKKIQELQLQIQMAKDA